MPTGHAATATFGGLGMRSVVLANQVSDLFVTTVLGRRLVTPGMVRVTLGGPGLAAFRSTGVADESVRLYFPQTAEAPQHSAAFSIRHVRAGEIDVDFVLHPAGRASDWAAQAEPGDRVQIGRPRGQYAPPADTAWQLLVADAPGLPALGRILEEMPAGTRAIVLAEVAEAAHQQALVSRADVSVRWLIGSGNGRSPSRLDAAVRATALPSGAGYAWVAAERTAAQPLRRYLRHDLGWVGHRYAVVRYWTADLDAWLAAWARLDPAIKAQVNALWASGLDPETIADKIDDLTAPFGL